MLHALIFHDLAAEEDMLNLQANYNLVIPTITALCAHIGVSDSAVGLVIGCCDIATIFGTLGMPTFHGHEADDQSL